MQTQTKAPNRPAWRGFVRAVGVVDFVLLAAAATWLTDLEAGLIALGILVAIALLRLRTGLLGFIVLALLFANVAVWMLPGALSNLSHDEAFLDTALPGALAIFSIAGLIAVIGYWIGLDQRVGRVLTGLMVIALVALAVVSLGSQEEAVARPGEIVVEMKDVKFLPEDLNVQAGAVSIALSNKDLFWHTLTIEDLDVNLRVPVRGERRLSFDAPAGTYEFVCAIPGHTQAGMKGTLEVR
jgi:plastocyanin